MPDESDDERVVTVSYARTHLNALIREVQAGRRVHSRRRDGRSATLMPRRPDPEEPKP